MRVGTGRKWEEKDVLAWVWGCSFSAETCRDVDVLKHLGYVSVRALRKRQLVRPFVKVALGVVEAVAFAKAAADVI